MQGSSQAIHSSAEGEVGVRQGTAYQVTSVRADVSTLMVTGKEGYKKIRLQSKDTEIDKTGKLTQPQEGRLYSLIKNSYSSPFFLKRCTLADVHLFSLND